MPNLDGGHYFLTALAPIRTDRLSDDIAGRSRSHRLQLAQKLSLMATGRQTATSPADAWPSPFAANRLNHLVRLVIIDGLPFNGRNPGDSLVDLIRKRKPLDPQPVDRLSTPYLLFAADVDARDPADTGGEAALRAYTDELWHTMQSDLRVIFAHCVGFDQVVDAAGFHAYVRRCQIETTMPFNDYWANGLPLASLKPPWGPVAAGGVALLAGVVALVALLGWGALVPALIVAVVAGVWLLHRFAVSRGGRPFPTAAGSDLPSILKALYLQQRFAAFAIDAQGAAPADLHARFAAFLGTTRPADLAAPTQPPGVVDASGLP